MDIAARGLPIAALVVRAAPAPADAVRAFPVLPDIAVPNTGTVVLRQPTVALDVSLALVLGTQLTLRRPLRIHGQMAL